MKLTLKEIDFLLDLLGSPSEMTPSTQTLRRKLLAERRMLSYAAILIIGCANAAFAQTQPESPPDQMLRCSPEATLQHPAECGVHMSNGVVGSLATTKSECWVVRITESGPSFIRKIPFHGSDCDVSD
jgi:hypothetical protein